ncbi:MAG: hypothetical protein K0S65_1345, partial [Labilithrix sp.]|nr:hypothetical protein [Labilithrix sp.]
STSRRATVLGLLALAVVGASAACGTEPVGVEACKKIERVRCESAPACDINPDRPLHSGDTPENDVAACIRYYDDQCLHGLVIAKEPSPQSVDACVDAIITGDCSVVKTPESHPACTFLIPPTAPAATTDAGSDADASVEDASDSG